MPVTRGTGSLEGYLAKKRASQAESLIKKELRSGAVLDVGCGSTPYFLMNTKFRSRYGIDPSVNISYSKESLVLKQVDICHDKLPFKDNFFSAVTMLAVFEHIYPEKLVAVLAEIRRVLKPNGRLIITTPCPWTDKLLRFMSSLNLISRQELKEHKGTYNHSAIINYMKKAGFLRIKAGYFEMYLNNWAYAEK